MTAQHLILHPTDFSACSAKAFGVASSLARDRRGQLLVLHVTPRPLTVLAGSQAIPPEPEEFDLNERRKQLAQLRAPEGVPCETRLEIGDEADRIIAVAKETGCDLIVMGTHGRSGVSRLLMGSVAEKVLRNAPCPVLTMRADPFKA